MSYFPVVIKASHLRRLREYVESMHGVPFEEVFAEMNRKSTYSQFNVMCNFLWRFHRSEYDWHFQQMRPGWHSGHAPVPGQVPDTELADMISDPQLTMPRARVAVHWTYLPKPPAEPDFPHLFRFQRRGLRVELLQVLAEGVCLADNDASSWYCRPASITHCKPDSSAFSDCTNTSQGTQFSDDSGRTTAHQGPRAYSRDALQLSLFSFEGYSWAWDARAAHAQHEHFSTMDAELRRGQPAVQHYSHNAACWPMSATGGNLQEESGSSGQCTRAAAAVERPSEFTYCNAAAYLQSLWAQERE